MKIMNLRNLMVIAMAASAVALLANGCSTPAPTATGTVAATTPAMGKSGAQLWGDRCGFCHNVRSPNSFNDAQWEVATMHMRVRANLTGEEQRKILEFLKSAD
jgi:cytochrome c5